MRTFFSAIYFILQLFLLPHLTVAQRITTIAGNGGAGYSGDGGPGILAGLNIPTGLAFDKDGNLLITDQDNYLIRKLDLATGIITTVAGGNSAAPNNGDGGPASKAGLYGPSGIAVDKAGNIYIAEQYASTIRRIDGATGIITTIAGRPDKTGYSGDGGPSVNALLSRPLDVEVDAAGNIYVVDSENNAIRKIDAVTRVITTVAGTYPGVTGYAGDGGPAISALLNSPARIHFDPAGNLYIADQENNVIRKIDAVTGIINRVIGVPGGGYFGDGGAAINAGLRMPAGMKMDAEGNIYIADTHNHAIRMVDAATGVITTVAGNGISGFSGDGGPPAGGTFFRPTEVLPDNEGNLYIADARNNRIRKISLCPQISLGNDISMCKSETTALDAGTVYTSFQWNTGATTQTIRTDVPGNYWVEARNGKCVARDTITVKQYPVPSLDWEKKSVICAGSSIIVNTPTQATGIQWQDGAAATSYTISQPGKYWVDFTDKHSCIVSDTVVIDRTIQAPADFLVDDTTFCSFDVVHLQPATSFNGYLWSTGSTARTLTVDRPGVYSLEVEDQHHCKWQETVAASVKACERYVIFPNVFTPNNDGKNDVFKPGIKGRLSYYKMTIYNRWGQKIFETTDWRAGWNGLLRGEPQGTGPYVWWVTYQLPGESPKTEKGVMSLLR